MRLIENKSYLTSRVMTGICRRGPAKKHHVASSLLIGLKVDTMILGCELSRVSEDLALMAPETTSIGGPVGAQGSEIMVCVHLYTTWYLTGNERYAGGPPECKHTFHSGKNSHNSLQD